MPPEILNEREFELINIIGAELGSNQRDISRHMNLSLGMINILVRRLIAKGYIRIEQLNKKKVQYLLTRKGFTEKMRKSVKYTMKTISSIGLIKNRVREILHDLHAKEVRNFYYYGNSDIFTLVDMVFRESMAEHCSLQILKEIPETAVNGTLLICKEGVEEGHFDHHQHVDLLQEIAKDNYYAIGGEKSAMAENI
ncbi:MAG: hypothetical protein A3C36_01385 [Omnitrophica WOR_2 bacterium RIFCSPHIGHO2_02_FULL_52_10]|nr:MAG: hypothetical protein A3C36_01385 [Omnitrophica WOR_2 bacterium RIFCSPHIGHO2_02_FULL_52_10]